MFARPDAATRESSSLRKSPYWLHCELSLWTSKCRYPFQAVDRKSPEKHFNVDSLVFPYYSNNTFTIYTSIRVMVTIQITIYANSYLRFYKLPCNFLRFFKMPLRGFKVFWQGFPGIDLYIWILETFVGL